MGKKKLNTNIENKNPLHIILFHFIFIVELNSTDYHSNTE